MSVTLALARSLLDSLRERRCHMKKQNHRVEKKAVRSVASESFEQVSGGLNPQPLPPGFTLGIVVGT